MAYSTNSLAWPAVRSGLCSPSQDHALGFPPVSSPPPASTPAPSAGVTISPRTYLPRKPSVPKATDLAKLAPKSDKNHIMENRRSACHLHPPNFAEEEEPRRHKSFGAVPDYLIKRKKAWEEEEERRRSLLPDPNCPPGMRLMSEEERWVGLMRPRRLG